MLPGDVLMWGWIACFVGAFTILAVVMFRHGYRGKYMALDDPDMQRRISPSGQRWLLLSAALFVAFAVMFLAWTT